MVFKSPSVHPSSSLQNHRKSLLGRGLRWFLRFSQFYGEYTVRSPQERQQWLAQQSDREASTQPRS